MVLRRRVSSDIQTLRSRFFKRLRGVWISDETHVRVFDVASQKSIILGEIQGQSWQNFMVIRNTYPNHGHSSDFPCFLLMNF